MYSQNFLFPMPATPARPPISEFFIISISPCFLVQYYIIIYYEIFMLQLANPTQRTQCTLTLLSFDNAID